MSGQGVPWLALGLVVVGAVALRVIGLQYGLPAVYNPDEAAIMARALSFARGTLNPDNFLYPTFYFYVLFAWVGVYLGFVWLTGRVESMAGLPRLYFTDPTGIYTAGRTLGVVTGAATVLAVHRLTVKLVDQRAALAAALFLAVAPVHVRDSHYVKHDVPATLAIVLAYVAMVRLWPGTRPDAARTRDTLVAGAACGVAFSTHYYSVFLAVPLALVIVRGWRAEGISVVVRQLAWGAAASAAVFFALSPFIALEPFTAWRDITANRQIVVDRVVAAGAFAPAVRYGQMLWHDSVGVPLVLLGLAGAVWMLVREPGRAVLLLAFPVPFLLFIMNTAPASRYLNPLVPFLAIFSAWTLSTVFGRGGWRSRGYWMAVALAATPALVQSIESGLFFRQEDTRTLAERYIHRHLPAEATILVQPYSVMLTPSRTGLVEALTHHLGDPDRASIKFQLQLSLDPYPHPAYRLIYLGRGGMDVDKIYVDYSELGGPQGLDRLRSLGVAFVVFKRYNEPEPEALPLLAALADEGRRIAAFSPYRPGLTEAEQSQIEPFLHNTDTRIRAALDRPGPPVEIWRIDEKR